MVRTTILSLCLLGWLAGAASDAQVADPDRLMAVCK